VSKKKNNMILAAGTTSILVVDDHPIVCDGLADLINQEADLVVIAKAGTAAEAIKAVKEQQIDLAIVDMLLKNETGIQVIKKIKALCPNLIVLIFSMSDELRYIKQAFEVGARGYITKDELSEKIIDVIRQILDGGIYLNKRLAKKFSKHELNEFLIDIHYTKLCLNERSSLSKYSADPSLRNKYYKSKKNLLQIA
jgi:DNA-binding NarL/FixJ family response regulator